MPAITKMRSVEMFPASDFHSIHIAIVGLACRFPGDASCPQKFWELLRAGRDVHSPTSKRWNSTAFHHPRSNALNTTRTKGGNFLAEDVDVFDAAFFNITYAEAIAMDPQQRLTLEVAYEAFENAGIPIERLANSKTGCFVGSSSSDYRETLFRDPESAPQYTLLGVTSELLSNRLSWFFDLHGPSMTVQTACSSGLVALHLACQSLRSGESEMAVAGGVNLMLNPDFTMYLSNLSFISKQGHSRSFDAEGDGYARGEGCGIVVLKRLNDAARDGDPIRAIIRASGVNSDGLTQGITTPSAEVQAMLIREVYTTAGLDMDSTQYVEAHGTGTKAGDPVEMRAIHNTLGKNASKSRKLIVGSVKPAIGHLEAASGIAGLIKGVLAMENELIPPNLFFDRPNPAIPFDEWNITVPSTLMPWPGVGTKRMSISSFGMGGTNAHIVLEGAAQYPLRSLLPNGVRDAMLNGHAPVMKRNRRRLFLLSSHDQAGLGRLSQSLAAYLDKIGPAASTEYAAHLAYTLGARRSKLSWKAFCLASDLQELRSKLAAMSEDMAIRSNTMPRIGFVFTGQGAQWPRMGIELSGYDVFQASVQECDAYLMELGCEWNALTELNRPEGESRIDVPEISQPLCTVLQIALIDLLRSWGVKPSKVVGHSSGEIAAAYYIGALTKRDAIAVAYFRGLSSSELKRVAPHLKGGMMAVGCSLDEAEEWISKLEKDGKLTVACVNSPSSVTISGDAAALDLLQRMLQEKSVFARRLKVDMAYHSHHMHAIFPIYAQSISDVRGQFPDAEDNDRPIMVSSVMGAEVEPEMLGSYYWIRNLVSPVLFSDALVALVAPSNSESKSATSNAVDLLVEVGPHSALCGPIKQILQEREINGIQYESVLTRGKNAIDTVLELAGTLFARGVRIDVQKVNADRTCTTLTDLPPYPWNHSRKFSAESRLNREYRMRQCPRKSLLGAPVPTMNESERLWRGHLRLLEEDWIRDHKIQSSVLFPGAGLIAMALEAARETADAGKTVRIFRLRDVEIGAAIMMSDDGATEFIVQLRPHLVGTVGANPAAWWEFSVSTSAGAWQPVRQNCRGLLYIDYVADHEHTQRELAAILETRIAHYQDVVGSCLRAVPVKDFYQDLYNIGLCFGETFRNVTRMLSGPEQCAFEITVGDPGETFSSGQLDRPHLIHPTTLDALFQALAGALYTAGGGLTITKTIIPTFIAELEISYDIPAEVGTCFKGYGKSRKHGFRDVVANIFLFDKSAAAMYVAIQGFRCTEMSGLEGEWETASSETQSTGLCSKISWEHAIDLMTPEEIERIVGGAGCGESLAKIVGMILHANPEITILELLPDQSAAFESTITPSLGTTLTNQVKYAITGNTQSLVNSNSDGKANSEISILNLSETVNGYSHAAAEFDLVVIPQTCCSMENFDKTLDRLSDLLKPKGKLLCCVKHELCQQILNLKGFHVDLNIGYEERLTVFSAPGQSTETNGMWPMEGDVLVIEPPLASATGKEFLGQLLHALRSHDITPSTAPWNSDLCDAVNSKRCICLLELEQSCLETLSRADFGLVREVVLKSESLLWITGFNHPSSSLVTGMFRSIRNEIAGKQLQTLHLSHETGVEHGPQLAARILISSSKETEFLEEAGALKISRLAQDHAMNTDIQFHMEEGVGMMTRKDCDVPLRLSIGTPGLLDTLYFEPDDRGTPLLAEHEVEIQVKASGVNFRDIMSSMGLLADSLLGCEASGVITATGSKVTSVKVGDRVTALGHGAHATVLRTCERVCAVIPDSVSFEEASAIPVVHTTAYHALVNRAKLRRGQSVLIHAAAGGVGQAAIQLAQHLGLTIFATVGSADKRKLIVDKYGVPDANIFHSRDASFVHGVMRVTGGRGVDCVLNSLAGELLRQSWYCLAPFGTFVEIGMRDVTSNTRLDMRPFVGNTTFTFFNMLDVMAKEPELMGDIFHETFALVRQGVLKAPSPLTGVPVHALHDAFRLMQSGKHRGKVVLSYGENDDVPVIRRPQDTLKLDPASTYLLVGGLGGLGRSLARMLVDSGARNLAFVSRSGAISHEARAIVDELVKRAVNLRVYCVDVAEESSFQHAMRLCAKELPPIKGVFQMAMVLQDALFENMTHEQWTACTRPKIQGTWNLHHFQHEHELDFFVILSSCASVFGNKGQANYAAACAFQDQLAHYRRTRGLKAVSVDLGIMRDVGVLSEKGAVGDVKRWEEALGIREPAFHALMKSVVNGQRGPHAADFPWQICTGLGTGDIVAAAGIRAPYYFDDARFAQLAMSSRASSDRARSALAKSVTVESRLAEAGSMALAVQIITGALVTKISEILHVPSSEVDPSRPMYLYGVDSLVAMEVRNWILKEMKANVALIDILAAVPMGQFAQKIAESSKLVSYS